MDLIKASINGNFQIVKLLLDQGSKPNTKNYDGSTGLIWASLNGHLIDYGAEITGRESLQLIKKKLSEQQFQTTDVPW